MEVWKDVVGFEDYYQVSNLGNVRSKDRFYEHPKGHYGRKMDKGKLLTLQTSWDGYHYASLSVNSKQKRARVNRLVAMAFIPNPLGLPCVNHINEIRDDNRVENLEWCTHKQNTSHGRCIAKSANAKKKPVVGTDAEGKQHWFPSAKDAEAFGYKSAAIYKCVRGEQKQHGGMTWQKV